MASDLLGVLGLLVAAVSGVILVLAAYRAVEIGRASVSPVYRRRAFWTAAFVVLVVINLFDSFSSPPLLTVFGILGGLSLVLLEVTLFAFVDGAVTVAIDNDFFHRDSMKWSRLRSAFYPIVVFSAADSVFLGSYYQSEITSSLWSHIPALGVVLLLIVFCYSAAALVVSARRTADRTLKWHVRILGFSVLSIVVAIFDQIAYSWSGYNLPLGIIFIVISYLLYLAVMSLSLVGKVEKAVEADVSPR